MLTNSHKGHGEQEADEGKGLDDVVEGEFISAHPLVVFWMWMWRWSTMWSFWSMRWSIHNLLSDVSSTESCVDAGYKTDGTSDNEYIGGNLQSSTIVFDID